jgi:hypothetical protein
LSAIETYWKAGMWNNRVVGEERPFSRYLARFEAISDAADRAKRENVEYVVYTMLGKVSERIDFGATLTKTGNDVEAQG